jgi:hypothetical protein
MHRSELLRGKVVSVSGSTSSETYGNTVGPEERRGKDEVIMNTEWPVMKSRSLTPSQSPTKLILRRHCMPVM